jgi:hypothetical protein
MQYASIVRKGRPELFCRSQIPGQAEGVPARLRCAKLRRGKGRPCLPIGCRVQSSVGDGILETGTDTLLGSGTVSGHNWTLTMSTTGLSSGTHTIFAQALDSDGLLSAPIAITLTIA